MGADRLGRVVEDAAAERLAARLAAARRLGSAKRTAAPSASPRSIESPSQPPGAPVRLGEPDVLGHVGGAEHAALADHGISRRFSGVSQLTSSRPCGAVLAEAHQAGDQVLLGGVHAAAAFGVDAR